MRRPRVRAFKKIYYIQAWDEDQDDWITIEKADCWCFVGMVCLSNCALVRAKDLEEIEGQGNVRVAHRFVGSPNRNQGLVLWPLGQVHQLDVAAFSHYKTHMNWANLENLFTPYTDSVL